MDWPAGQRRLKYQMTGYTPLFGSIVTSSIWNEDSETRIVWITMLALSNAKGMVEGSISGLAPVARVSLEACEKALARLKQPDKYSRTREFDGRRIEDADGGWQILNYTKFREKAKSRAEYYQFWRKNRDVTPEEMEIEKNKSRIRMLISRAIRNEEITNPETLTCTICSKQAEMYHHPNGYDKEHELDIVPICKKCHRQLHLHLKQDTQTQTQTQTAKHLETVTNCSQQVAKTSFKTKYLDFVMLTEEEHKKLTERFGEQGVLERISALNDGIGSKGYKYKSHYHTILSWERLHQTKGGTTGNSPPPVRDFQKELMKQRQTEVSQQLKELAEKEQRK